MLLSNIESLPGYEVVAHFGLVSGNTVRAKHFGRDIAASFKNLVGGELKGYTELLEEARGESVNRMTQQAKALGANAIINVRFSTSAVTQGAAELYVYGTAVQVRQVGGTATAPSPSSAATTTEMPPIPSTPQSPPPEGTKPTPLKL